MVFTQSGLFEQHIKDLTGDFFPGHRLCDVCVCLCLLCVCLCVYLCVGACAML